MKDGLAALLPDLAGIDVGRGSRWEKVNTRLTACRAASRIRPHVVAVQIDAAYPAWAKIFSLRQNESSKSGCSTGETWS